MALVELNPGKGARAVEHILGAKAQRKLSSGA
jgi:hypothetical protein